MGPHGQLDEGASCPKAGQDEEGTVTLEGPLRSLGGFRGSGVTRTWPFAASPPSYRQREWYGKVFSAPVRYNTR